MIQLPKQVLNSDILKRLMYHNMFMVGEMLSKNITDEDLNVVLISMIGMGGFAYDVHRDESKGQVCSRGRD